MNIQEYIASGIIEAYVLGMASAEEADEFEKNCDIYPEIKEARIAFETALEEKMLAGTIIPAGHLKETIFEQVRSDASVHKARKIISIAPEQSITKKKTRMQWMAAASIILLVATGSFIYFLYEKNNELKNEIAKSKETLEQIDSKNTKLEVESVPDNYIPKQVNVTMPEQSAPASVSVFWDSTNTHVYLVIKDLEKLPADQKYQVWSVNKGQYSSLGLFDAPTGNKLILKVNNAQASDAFAISVAKGIPTTPLADSNNVPGQK